MRITTEIPRGAIVGRVMVSVIATLAIGACGGTDSTSIQGGVGVSGNLTVAPTSVTIVQGHTATVTLTLALKGRSPGSITFNSQLPKGITATYSPASLSGSGSTTVTLTAAADADLVKDATPFFLGFVGTDTLVLDGQAPSIDLTVRNGRPGIQVIKTGSGSGNVTSTPAGLTCGSICSAIFDFGSITLTAVPAAGSVLTSWSGTCTGTALTCTFTPNDFGNVVTATFTSTAPAVALAVAPSPVIVEPGVSTTATVTLTRINGYTDPANLTITAPAGITVSANPASVTGTTSTLTVSAAASQPAGYYPVTLTATGTGVAQQSITVPVQVPAAASGGAITFNYTGCDPSRIPVWFAVQNGAGPWTRVTPTGNAFTFTLGPTGGYAFVTRHGTDTVTSVTYATATEIAAIAGANPCGTDPPTGSKQLFGLIRNVGNPSQGIFANVTVGGAQFIRTVDSLYSVTLVGVPSGPRDLIATAIAPNSPINVSRMIIRRNTNYANNQNIGAIDFAGAETFIPVLGALTPLNLLGDQIDVTLSLLTANGLSAPYYSSNFLGTGGNTRLIGMPDTQLAPGDFHVVSITAAPPSGNDFRVAELLTHSVNTATATPISFGPRVSGAAVTTVATTPYLRPRGQVASQATYTAAAVAEFAQGGRTIAVAASAAYFGSAPTTWTLDVPDLSAAGYDQAWALSTGQSTGWQVYAAGGSVLPFFGGNPVDNAQMMIAGAYGSATGSPAPRGQIWRGVRRWR